MNNNISQKDSGGWPQRPDRFPDLMTPLEAAMFLRLDELGHDPKSAVRTLNYWRDQGHLRATKYARHVWYLKKELEKFLENKTEESL
ncbi:MAG: helix-turn-helix domain-containing protein [Anaerohalosphaera sp.]|nr:helix-turn-helix domain-containing protein [Anaerohalosphaera sp.]